MKKGVKKNGKKAKVRNSKKSVSKKKPKRIKSDSRRSQKKIPAKRKPAPKPKPKPKKKIPSRKPGRAKKTKVALDTRFWRSVAKRTVNIRSRAEYSTKSLRHPRTKLKFKIKKKIKQLNASNNGLTYGLMSEDANKFLKSYPKKVYIKLAYREKSGKIRFASAPRQTVDNAEELRGIFALLQTSIRSYGEVTIAGYEFEETL